MKNTTQYPLKQKWTVPIDNGWKIPLGINGLTPTLDLVTLFLLTILFAILQNCNYSYATEILTVDSEVSWVRCGAWLHQFLIYALFLT